MLRRDRSGRGLPLLVAVLAALLFAAPATAATVRHVDDSGDDLAGLNDCTADSPPLNPPCRTIQQAVDKAASGDVIQVGDGTYDEHVTIAGKAVHLVGAQAGVDARGRSASESAVLQGFETGADSSGTSVDGFLIDPTGASTVVATGINLSASSSGYRVVNNRISNHLTAVLLGTSGASQTLIRHNALVVPPGSTRGISGPSDVANVAIDANSMSGPDNRFVQLRGSYSPNVAITGNTTEGDMEVRNLVDSSISGNTFAGGTTTAALRVAGGNTDLDVRRNVMDASTNNIGIIVSPEAGSNRSLAIVGNDIRNHGIAGIQVFPTGMSATLPVHFNAIVGNGGGSNGVGIDNAGATPIDAENNWWGCNGGPLPTGTTPTDDCNQVDPGVDAAPWLVLTATAERARVLTGGDTNRISAGFTSNSVASTLDTSEFPPTSVTFPAATLGTVSPAATTTSGGIAQTLYSAGSTAGSGNVTAHVDAENVTTSNFEVSSQAGPQGVQGDPGQTGQTGPQGPVGPQGPAGQQGPAGPSTPASPRDPNPVLILSNSLRATKQRIVAVSINCPVAAGLCDGRLGIGVGRSTLGNTSFLVNGGNRAVIRLRGSANIIRAAIKKKKVTVVVLSRDNAGTAALTSKIVKFRK